MAGVDIISDSTGKAIQEAISNNGQSLLDEFKKLNLILAAQGEGLKIKSWKHLQEIIRLGQVRNYLSVGDQLVVQKAAGADTWIVNEKGEAGITGATVDFQTFENKVVTLSDLNFDFIYDGIQWEFEDNAVNLEEYGISYTGTPNVGDTIVVHKRATDILFDVIGIDHPKDIPAGKEHCITIESHYTLVNIPFDTVNALIYVGTPLLANTPYTIGVPSAYDKDYHTYDYYTFTPTVDIPVGSQIMFNWIYQRQPTGVTVYANSSATTGTTYPVTGETSPSGTLLCNATATDISTSGEVDTVNLIAGNQVNTLSRCRYGSNYYITSGLRQYLNTKPATNNWWEAKTVFSRPHSMNNQANWQYGLDEEFLKVVQTVQKGIYTQKWDNGTDGNSTETFMDKFFIPSYREVAGCTFSPYNNEVEGNQYEYYNNLVGTITSDYQTKPALIKTDAAGATRYWWFRSAQSGDANIVRLCFTTGHLSTNSAHIGHGVSPACVIA